MRSRISQFNQLTYFVSRLCLILCAHRVVHPDQHDHLKVVAQVYKLQNFCNGSVFPGGERDHRLRLRPKYVGVRSKKFSDSDWSLLFLDSIRQFRFPTNQLFERLKTNSTADSDDFARLQPKSVGVWSENFSDNNWSSLLSDPIGKLRSSTLEKLLQSYAELIKCRGLNLKKRRHAD